jgi:hypothetical protein
MAVDAHVLYGLIRTQRPSRLIEVGVGESTRLVAHAAALNAAEGSPPSVTAIDPYPPD